MPALINQTVPRSRWGVAHALVREAKPQSPKHIPQPEGDGRGNHPPTSVLMGGGGPRGGPEAGRDCRECP